MAHIRGRVLIAQGGGPTAVINQSLVGAVLQARNYTDIELVYGSRFGVRGIRDENFVNLSQIDSTRLEHVAKTTGSALGSTRDKPDTSYCEKMFVSMQKNDIRYFFYIGGNDSADTCRIINEEAKRANYELRVIHIPKTIDNDLVGTDHCPGYGSAATFIARAFQGVDLDNRSLPGVYIGVVMGRHAGFLAAASMLGKQSREDGPHLIYTPEKTFNVHHFTKNVKEIYDQYGRCVIAVSEGIADESHIPIATTLAKQVEHDAHGNVQLSGSGVLGDLLAETVKNHAGISRVRVDTFGYLQRSFASCVSSVDAREAREVGVAAMQFAMSGDVDGSVAINRNGEYAVDYSLIPLGIVAGQTKTMADKYFESDTMVSDAFVQYARPLIGELDTVAHLV